MNNKKTEKSIKISENDYKAICILAYKQRRTLKATVSVMVLSYLAAEKNRNKSNC